jgi:hypothetical protein
MLWVDSDSTVPPLDSVIAAHRAIAPIRPVRDYTVNWTGKRVAVQEPLLMRIAGLTAVLHSHINNLDVVLLATTTCERALAFIEPISKHAINRTWHS